MTMEVEPPMFDKQEKEAVLQQREVPLSDLLAQVSRYPVLHALVLDTVSDQEWEEYVTRDILKERLF